MASAREESGYGKFKKRPFRRQTTPYDRPTTALRNTTSINLNNNNGGIGWLSKLVDPAQRLIVSSAHRLFGSVLRKRLAPPPPPPPEPEANNEAKDMDQEQVSTDHPGVQGAVIGHDCLNDSSDRGGLTELEQILKQKTFSRSEIDQLTALLRSRSADMSVGDEQKSPEVIPSKPVVFNNRMVASLDSPVRENGIGSQLITTPVVSSTVLDEDIASPTELAKAYMGGRPSKGSPSMLGVKGQAFREESTVLSNQPLPSVSSVMSLVPRSSGHVGVRENGFVTPRFRGRSAIYSMARTPYSRIHSTSTFKGDPLAIDSVAGPSSSTQSTWEKNSMSGSKQGTLKRRSTVLDNDIGSVGSIRRIRQKSNFLYPKNLSLPASGSPLSVRGSGVTDAVQYPSSSMQKPLISGEHKHSFTSMFTENEDNSVPSTSSTQVSSKSSEMASKILQQLDKLVYSRDKSPTKLSPSMLSGPALKSLENVDSSIFLENVQDNKKLNGSLGTKTPAVRDSSSQKHDRVEANGSTKSASPSCKLILAMNKIDASSIIKDNVPSTKTTDSPLTNSIALLHPHPQKKRTFQMSAHEDYLELDDDDHSDGPASVPLADGRDKPNASSHQITVVEAIAEEKSPANSDIKSASPVLSDKENSDGAVATGKSSVFSFSTIPSTSITAKPAEVATQSTLTSNTAANELSAAPVFGFGEKIAPPKVSNAVSTAFSPSTTNVDKVPQFASPSLSAAIDSSPFKFGAPLNSNPESSTSLASVAIDVTDSARKVSESEKADNRVFFKTTETSLPSAASTSSSTASKFPFGAHANGASLNNGSLSSSPSSTSAPSPPLFSSTGLNQNMFSSSNVLFTTTNSGVTSTTTTSAIPSTVAPVFNFGLTAVPSTSSSPISATSGVESTEGKKNDSGFGNSTSMLFSSAFAGTGSSTSSTLSLMNTSTGSSIFGNTTSVFTANGNSIFVGTSSGLASTGSSMFGSTSPSITNTVSNSFGGTSSTIGNTGSGIFGFSVGASSSAATCQAQASNPFSAGSAQASVNASGSATTTQSMPTQFGSSASSTSFELATNPTFSSGSSLFGSSTSAAKPFGSAPFGLNSSTSSSDTSAVSSSSGTATSVFGSSWQAPKTSTVFGSAFNSTSPSNVFTFGASASSAASSSTPAFGSSTSASTSSVFPFTSSAAAVPSQPVFCNTNPVFAFGSTATTNNNDQMNMEDMAEDTVPTSAPPVPAFGQQPDSTPPSFVFGSTAPSGANPFQFVGQQNIATPQNPSPFQASGSLDFNAGGSFSLGTGGDKSQRKIVKINRKAKKK